MGQPGPPSLMVAAQETDRGPVDGDRFCGRCWYNLRGLAETRCPECGCPYDPAAAPRARIPWIARHSTGSVDAYWRTVWLVLVHPSRVAHDLSRASTDEQEARSFRRVSLWHAFASFGLFAFVVLCSGAPDMAAGRLSNVQVVVFVTAAVCAVLGARLMLQIASDVSPFDTYPARTLLRRPQEAAINAYATAPWALLPLPALAGCAAIYLPRDALFGAAAHLPAAAGVLGLAIVFAYWLTCVRLFRAATAGDDAASVQLALLLPFRWCLIAMGSMLVALTMGAGLLFFALCMLMLIVER